METIQKAGDLYVKKVKQENQGSSHSSNYNTNTLSLDTDIHSYITIAIKSVPSATNLFSHQCIIDSLLNAFIVCVKNGLDVLLVAKAFTCLERYFKLLVQQPWKPEYKILKTYGGFYKTNIVSVLGKAEIIFIHAGYVIGREGQMVYKRTSDDSKHLLSLSFDCYVAHKICERINEHHLQLTAIGKTLDDAITDVLKNVWELCKPWDKAPAIKGSSTVAPQPQGPPPLPPKREPFPDDMKNGSRGYKEVTYSTGPSPMFDNNISNTNPEESLGNFKYKRNAAPHIPYMDGVEYSPKSDLGRSRENRALSVLSRGVENTPHTCGIDPPPPIAYPPRFVPNGNYLHRDIDRDEAPKSNFSAPSSYPMSSNISKSSDLGYGTDPYTIGIEPLAQKIVSDKIYRPPLSPRNPRNTTGTGMPTMPSRAQKPVFTQGQDCVDGTGMPTMPSRAQKPVFTQGQNCVNGPGLVQFNYGTSIQTAPGPHVVNPATPYSLHQLKSNSLKNPAKKLIVNDRLTRSLDSTHGQRRCSISGSSNLHSGSEVVYPMPAPGSTEPQKRCQTCTLYNNWRNTVCDACEAALPEWNTTSRKSTSAHSLNLTCHLTVSQHNMT